METIFFFFLKKKPTRENFEWKEQVNILKPIRNQHNSLILGISLIVVLLPRMFLVISC